jgi:hypothetical protein
MVGAKGQWQACLIAGIDNMLENVSLTGKSGKGEL